MNKQTKNWIFFTIVSYVLMFILIPPKKGPKISGFGFYLGFVQAVILKWFAVKKYKLWKIPGDILIKGIPILTCISWIPPAILYAYYFPYGKKLSRKTGYIFLFALGTTIAQYIQGLIGMWESKKWKPIYTFPLAITTHSIMTIFLPFFKLNRIRENS